ncbi:glycosyltransferase [Flavobacterium sp. J27]|uniref:glycosyltransferase family 2 protein n=1 Tax=Flavobacterium sp. J27 TaxID=2060419 RepID=UPI001F0E919B|nr:glycosyltransferase [Flavobacterium sp. J27]
MKTITIHETTPKNSFSIIIPFRNEAQNLPQLLKSISQLNFPKEHFEVILVDDDSEEKFQIQSYKYEITLLDNIRKSNSPKKDAIETAINIAKHDWIITTDADCLVHPNWLLILDNYIQQTHVKMIAAGVAYLEKKGFLHAFQNLDFLSLQGATIGSFGIEEPFMCNGANFCYRKDFFFELEGFQNNNNIASGDDVFLLQKAIKKDKKAIGFCLHQESIVHTSSVDTWKKVFFQRVRWASKSTEYHSLFGKSVAIIVFLANLFWIIFLMLHLLNQINTNYLLIYVGVKCIIDYIILLQTATSYQSKLRWLLISMIVYPIFSTTVAFYSLSGKYQWKGRTFRR